jgi:hypothetical protein
VKEFSHEHQFEPPEFLKLALVASSHICKLLTFVFSDISSLFLVSPLTAFYFLPFQLSHNPASLPRFLHFANWKAGAKNLSKNKEERKMVRNIEGNP